MLVRGRGIGTAVVLSLLVGTVVVVAPSADATTCVVGADLVNTCRPWLGANAGGYPGVPVSIEDQIEAHESRIGRQVDVAHTYHQPGQDELNAVDLAFVNRPGTLLFTSWKPAVSWADANGSDAAVNATIDQMAQSIKAVAPHRILLTIYHEPQNDVSGGAAGCPSGFAYAGTSGTPDDYRAMWRNVQARFDALGVDNVVWAVDYMSSSTFDCMVKDLWPGNDLVDWVLFDVYGSPTLTFDTGVSAYYNKLAAWSDAGHAFTSKPWGLGEWNIRNNYTQAQATTFYDDAKAALDERTYPRLKLWCVFDNANGKNTRVGYDSSGNVDATKQAHYSAFAQDPVFEGGWSGDRQPPTVSVTSPADGDLVAGTITVSGSADDDTAVAGVRLLVDGAYAGPAALASDGSVSAGLDTTALSNAGHDLALQATDASGLVTTSTTVTVHVDNRDHTPPSTPTGLAASPTSDEVALSWEAATDDTGLAGYDVERDGQVVATMGAEATTWTDRSVDAATTYTYTVVAEDAAGNRSTRSDPLQVTTPAGPDLVAPDPPGGVQAEAQGPTTVVVAWDAAVDDVGVATYQITRDGVVLDDNVSGTTYRDDTVADATTYTYRVRATDTSGNVSDPSEVATVTTPDATAPSQVMGVVATATAPRSVQVIWASATDNVGVAGYQVLRDGALVASPTGTSFTDTGVVDARSYVYQVVAVDAAGNLGLSSSQAPVTTPDGTAPTRPSAPTATATTGTTLALSWSASTDNVGVTGYHVYRDGTLAASLGAVTTWTATGLTSGASYQFTVDAFDAAGNLSPVSPVLVASTKDTVAPVRPTGVVATATAATRVTVSWAATTDNVAVTAYRVYRGSTLVATLGPVTSFQDSGLTPRTTYGYSVEALDAAGNVSTRSTTASATTPADTAAPSVPAALTGRTSGASVVLGWAASSDDVRVTGYGVYRNGTRIATTTSLTYTDTTAQQGVTYQYSVDAYDAADNRSARTAAVGVTVPDLTAPSKVSSLTLTAGKGSIALRWTAATDNVGVVGYRIYRGTALLTTVAGTVLTYTNTGLTSGTTYSYRVVAVDAAGNAGTSSPTVSAKAK